MHLAVIVLVVWTLLGCAAVGLLNLAKVALRRRCVTPIPAPVPAVEANMVRQQTGPGLPAPVSGAVSS